MKVGCTRCVGHEPITLEQLKQRGGELHGNKYDYSTILPEKRNPTQTTYPTPP